MTTFANQFHETRQLSRWLMLGAIIALVWMVLARLTGPSDLWEYTQHKTVGYTTDIIVHGGTHWLLPLERGEFLATKPPLYNWLAVPFVKLLGFSSELAHKFPSLIALCVCWLMVVMLGRRLDEKNNQAVGWLAGLILIANHTMFKLGYVARPDMLLTLWLTLAWVTATTAYINLRHAATKPIAHHSSQKLLAILFWLFIACAGMTKGPAAIVGVAYAFFAAKKLAGTWKAVRVLHPVIGLTFIGLIGGGWIFCVWRIDPHHLSETLWHNEFYGRVLGTGTEGIGGGLGGWLKSLPYHPFYFLGRFFPWSLCVIAAIIGIWQGKLNNQSTTSPTTILWLRGAAIQVVLVLCVFTLSTGKRADYIAAAFPPGALLASWWLLRMHPNLGLRFRWFAPTAAAIVLLNLTYYGRKQFGAPAAGFGSSVRRFIESADAEISHQPLPLSFCLDRHFYVQAFLGSSQPVTQDQLLLVASQNSSFWLIATKNSQGQDCTDELSQRSGLGLVFDPILESDLPPQVAPLTLYRVSRHHVPNHPDSSP